MAKLKTNPKPIFAFLMLATYISLAVFCADSARAYEYSNLDTWQTYLIKSYDAANHNKEKLAFKLLHKAFESLSQSGDIDTKAKSKTLLQEAVKLYKKFGHDDKALKISKLLLTAPFNPNQDDYQKEKLKRERKRHLLLAGDAANSADDYFLADLFYSSLLAGSTVFEAIETRSGFESKYQTKVVDRLVRLYLKHDDIKRSQNLIEVSKRLLNFTMPAQTNRDITQIRLIMLEIDLALVKLHQKDYKGSVHLFKKNIIKLERLSPRNKTQLATIYNDYALACDRLGKKSEAKRQYKRALQIAKQSPTLNKQTLSVIEKNYQNFLEKQ